MKNYYTQLAEDIKQWGIDAGFQQTGITDVDVSTYKTHYDNWLAANYHGEMAYMQRHAELRTNPALLQPNALRCISFRMDYHQPDTQAIEVLQSPSTAYISRYALGRDYHKLIRKRLAGLADKIQAHAEETLQQRAFVDSAPVLERALAEKAGLGWIGKNTMLINSKAGSWFFLGEILTDLPLPVDTPQQESHCGTCNACLTVCPTQAFIGPQQLDARKCISYLTIELKGAIPEALRPLMGNRVFGCDDCQLVCPWNKFAKATEESDFKPRHGLNNSELLALFQWSETEFLARTAGSPIHRIGYERWQRNLAVGLGNAPYSPEIAATLEKALENSSALLHEHLAWAIQAQKIKQNQRDGSAL
jgi:epoxyqueuosine reductase